MTQTHTVATDALETLGTHPIPDNSARDAIHLAVEPVVAGARLFPAQSIKIVDGEAFAASDSDAMGIVDPFLVGTVKPGQRFWLVVFPRQITSLRHVWSHPAFPEGVPYHAEKDEHYVASDKAASEAWLRDFTAKEDCPDYETVLGAAVSHAKIGGKWDDEYIHFDGQDAHAEIPPEFWKHVEIVTGISVPDERKATYFSCSC